MIDFSVINNKDYALQLQSNSFFKISDKGNETGNKNHDNKTMLYGCCVSMTRCSNLKQGLATVQ